MRDSRRVSIALALAMHDELLARSGGTPGTRDDPALADALCVRGGDKSSPFELAAAYAAGIIRNHPFLDGNKRTGFLAAYTFLEARGEEFDAPEEQVVLQTLALAAGEIREKEYAAWLKASCKPRPRRTKGK